MSDVEWLKIEPSDYDLNNSIIKTYAVLLLIFENLIQKQVNFLLYKENKIKFTILLFKYYLEIILK